MPLPKFSFNELYATLRGIGTEYLDGLRMVNMLLKTWKDRVNMEGRSRGVLHI